MRPDGLLGAHDDDLDMDDDDEDLDLEESESDSDDDSESGEINGSAGVATSGSAPERPRRRRAAGGPAGPPIHVD